eukprot:10568901-Prorocentrum_lima.AAC.1
MNTRVHSRQRHEGQDLTPLHGMEVPHKGTIVRAPPRKFEYKPAPNSSRDEAVTLGPASTTHLNTTWD